MRFKIYSACLLLLLSAVLAMMPAQRVFAAGEVYSWQGANIQGDLGVFSQGPGGGSPFEFGPNDVYYKVQTVQQGTAPLRFAFTTTGGSSYYGASQTWEFLVRHRISGEFRAQCTFEFKILVTGINHKRMPMPGAPSIYSVGTISVENKPGTGSITQNSNREDDAVGVCSGIAEHYEALTRNIEISGTAPESVVPNTPPPSTTEEEEDEEKNKNVCDVLDRSFCLRRAMEDEEKNKNVCDTPSGEIKWIVCPASSMLIEAANRLDEILVGLVKIDTAPIFSTDPETREGQSGQGFHKAWAIFRNLAYVLLIIIGLLMVLSQVMGLDLFDAYTVRKMLPKIVLAAIFIPLLWPLLNILFNMANDAADAIGQLITGPFNDLARDKTGFDQLYEASFIPVVLGALTTVGVAIAIGGIGVVFAAAASAAIFIISAVFVLFARDIVAYILIIASPLAIVCATFEPFKKAFGMWRGFLTTILLSIPAIAAVLAAGKVGASIAILANDDFGYLIALIIIVATYAMFWTIFKQLDKVTGQIGGLANRLTSDVQQRLAKYRGETMKRRWGERLAEQRASRGLMKPIVGIGQRFQAASQPGGGFLGEKYRAARQKMIKRTGAALYEEDSKFGDSGGDDELNEVLQARPRTFNEAVNALMALEEGRGRKITKAQAARRIQRALTNYGATIGSTALADAASRALAKSNTAYQTAEDEDPDIQFLRRYGDAARRIISGDSSIDTEASRLGDNPSRVEWMAGYTSRRKALEQAVQRLRQNPQAQALDLETVRALRREAILGNDPSQLIGANQRSMVHIGTALLEAYRDTTRKEEIAQAQYNSHPLVQALTGATLRARQATERVERVRSVMAENPGAITPEMESELAAAEAELAAAENNRQAAERAHNTDAEVQRMQAQASRQHVDRARVAAEIANIYQYMSYQGGQKSRILADTLTSRGIYSDEPVRPGTKNRPIWEVIEEEWRDDPSFRESRQEFRQRYPNTTERQEEAVRVGGIAGPTIG